MRASSAALQSSSLGIGSWSLAAIVLFYFASSSSWVLLLSFWLASFQGCTVVALLAVSVALLRSPATGAACGASWRHKPSNLLGSILHHLRSACQVLQSLIRQPAQRVARAWAQGHHWCYSDCSSLALALRRSFSFAASTRHQIADPWLLLLCT